MGTIGLYRHADVYDALHLPGTRAEVRTLQRLARRFGAMPAAGSHRAAVWLEPACGTARHLRIAAARGARVIGIDTSREMLDFARARLREASLIRRAKIVQGDIARVGDLVPSASVDVAFVLINSIRHLATDRTMLDHLRGMTRVLRAGGIYAVGLSLSAYGFEQESEDVWSARHGSARVTQVVQYIPPTLGSRRERVISHVSCSTRAGRVVFEDVSTYWLRTYSLDQWRRLVDLAGLSVLGVVDQDGVDTMPTEPGYAVWILGVKPKSQERAMRPPTRRSRPR
ncbi:MAG: class I SAM-dependent methyltransferase [Phycisphaerales bacterium]|nr:MAG: class I SAM-dependent methyltransferase [Phycisphaerales bacterium]